MRKLWVFAGACLLLTGGCTASLDTSLVRIGGSVSLPALEGTERQAVVYPAGVDKAGQFDELTNAYGPAWRDLQAEYPEYRFN